MERNRWETAIRCLEVALHPNTDDDQVIAAVNGFRRITRGMLLREVCSNFVGANCPHPGAAADAPGWQEQADRVNRENRDLRRALEAEKAGRIMALYRLQKAEQRIRELGEELLTAQGRAGAAEQQLADLRASAEDLRQENRDLRAALESALEQAHHTGAGPHAPQAAAPFREFLAAARLRTDRPETVSPDRESGAAPGFGRGPRKPWTA
jgi:septal ring factor EnvC (AmiA/AmiB activator)